ncbi:MAG: D-aminopeptidase [Fimbriimonadaceae bacterium]|nr:D-aminopeptidase [Fimbriimonadaceae bacterium]
MVTMIATLIASTLLCQESAPTPASLTAFLESLEAKSFRGMVYVEQAGKEKFFHTVGYADPAAKRSFTRDTGICMGSIVKPMVRVALFKLVEKGKLGLDDPISKFFDNVPADKKAITLRILAEHRAGFKDVFGGDYQPMERDELMAKMLASDLIFTPGQREEYSNSGFSMLATILEKVSGRSIEALIDELEFKPLGLKRTGYVRPGWKPDQLAVGYRSDGKRFGTPLDKFWYKDGPSWNLRGNGGMLTTVRELARWTRAFHEFGLISREQHKLLEPGLHVEDASRRFASFAGGNNIWNTVASYNPGKRIVIIATSWDGRFAIENEGRTIIRQVYGMLGNP